MLIWYERKTLLAGWLTSQLNRTNANAQQSFFNHAKTKSCEGNGIHEIAHYSYLIISDAAVSVTEIRLFCCVT